VINQKDVDLEALATARRLPQRTMIVSPRRTLFSTSEKRASSSPIVIVAV
jgi:hypothetical protein